MKRILMVSITLLSVCSAFAKLAEEPVTKVQKIRFEDLKVACSNPARFHNQIAPSDIQISCGEVKTKWVADQDGIIPLNTRQIVTTTVVSNKYTVSPAAIEIASEPQEAPCTQYKQVVESVETVHSTTCEQLLAFQGTSDEYCAMTIEALRIANPDSIKIADSGNQVSFCTMQKQKTGNLK